MSQQNSPILPPRPNLFQQSPTNNPDNSNFNSLNQGFNGVSGFNEYQNNTATVSRTRSNRISLKLAIKIRHELEVWLKHHGLGIQTFAVDLQRTHSFIASSQIIYPNGQLVDLAVFLHHSDPVIQNIATQIEQQMIEISHRLNVATKADFF
jgi:hypothetical protein